MIATLWTGSAPSGEHGDEGVAALVVGCDLPDLLADDGALALCAHDDAVLRGGTKGADTKRHGGFQSFGVRG